MYPCSIASFCSEASVRIRGTALRCTQGKCQWIIPSYLKSVEYFPVENIDFKERKENCYMIAVKLQMNHSMLQCKALSLLSLN